MTYRRFPGTDLPVSALGLGTMRLPTLPQPENPIDEEFYPTQAYRQEKANVYHNFIQHQTSWKCGNCLQYCPVGNWKERFHDTNVSKLNVNQFIDNYPDVDMDTYNGEVEK